MRHFLEISQLTAPDIYALVDKALYFKRTLLFPHYPQKTVAHLFYENSTRTLLSFQLAATRLGMSVVNVDLEHSSERKGESTKDTMRTLSAMGIDFFVIRHSQDRAPHELATHASNKSIVINAGDGKNAHPSQAMLDVMTVMEQRGHLKDLKMAIMGDIAHSRVAHSWQQLAKQVEIKELRLIAPSIWQPATTHYGQMTSSLKEGLADADVIVCLRVQKERLADNEQMDLEMYHQQFALTPKTLTYAKPNAMVLHPGPINRGIEIDSEVADGPQSYILQQVENGVFMRMAILSMLAD